MSWHFDVPDECPCKGAGWSRLQKEDSGSDPNTVAGITEQINALDNFKEDRSGRYALPASDSRQGRRPMSETGNKYQTLGKFLHDLRSWPRQHPFHHIADDVEKLLAPILTIDLSKVSPLPWIPAAENRAIADTGDYEGLSYVTDKDRKYILGGDGDCPGGREILIGNWYHDPNCVLAAACVNAVARMQASFRDDGREPEESGSDSKTVDGIAEQMDTLANFEEDQSGRYAMALRHFAELLRKANKNGKDQQ